MPLPSQYTQLPQNTFGGNCSQERLDSIKFAWMDRHGTTEQDWASFQQQTRPLYNEEATFERTRVNPYAEEQRRTESDKELAVVEHPLCPNWAEMAMRYKSKARTALSMARHAQANGYPATARNQHFENALVWREHAQSCAKQDLEIRRNN